MLNAKTQWWIAELADFKFSTKYQPGKANGDTDGLSWMPLDMEQYISTQLSPRHSNFNLMNASPGCVHPPSLQHVLMSTCRWAVLKSSLAKVMHLYNCTWSNRVCPRLSVDIMFSLTPRDQSSSHSKYPSKWRKRIQEAYRLASKTAQREQNRGKKQYDCKTRSGTAARVQNIGAELQRQRRT